MDFTVNERGLKLISTAIRHKARLCRSCDEFTFSAVQYTKHDSNIAAFFHVSIVMLSSRNFLPSRLALFVDIARLDSTKHDFARRLFQTPVSLCGCPKGYD